MGHRSKSEVTFHSDGYRGGHAAVNVKDRTSYAENLRIISTVLEHQGMTLGASTTLESLAEAIGEHFYGDWDPAAEACWSQADEDAKEIFGRGYGVASEGRSGGWCVVTYNDRVTFDAEEVAGWDAIMLSKWWRFADGVRLIADDYPYQMADLYLVNIAEVGADVESLQAAGVGL